MKRISFLCIKILKLRKEQINVNKFVISSKKYSQFQEGCQRHTLFLQNIPGNIFFVKWQMTLRQMANDTITTLVQNSFEKSMIKEEKGLITNFLGIIFSVKMLLGMHWNCLVVTVRKISIMPISDWLNQGLYIQTYLYDYIIYSITNELLYLSKILILILYLLWILEAQDP